MTLEEALYLAIAGPKRLTSEGGSVASMIAEIERAVGGKSYSDAARFAGVPRTTWRNWRRGSKPKPGAYALLRDVQRRVRLSAAREAFLRGRPAVRVYADVTVSQDTRTRTLRVSTYTSWSALDRFNPILDAWLKGHDHRAARLLMTVIEREIGAGVQLDNPRVRTFKTESAADYWARSQH